MRTGLGYDVHKLVEGRPLVLGGVTIPFVKGLLGHSDADVLVHALCDALLGAAGLGDIGEHFPDHDPAWRGISSLKLLEAVKRLLKARHWHLVNADMVLVAQAPRISPYKDAMRRNIAESLEVAPDRINIKATTTEGLGSIGREEGMAAFCTVLLSNEPPHIISHSVSFSLWP